MQISLVSVVNRDALFQFKHFANFPMLKTSALGILYDILCLSNFNKSYLVIILVENKSKMQLSNEAV